MLHHVVGLLLRALNAQVTDTKPLQVQCFGAARQDQAEVVSAAMRRRRAWKPTRPKPAISMAQTDGSETLPMTIASGSLEKLPVL